MPFAGKQDGYFLHLRMPDPATLESSGDNPGPFKPLCHDDGDWIHGPAWVLDLLKDQAQRLISGGMS